MNINQYYLYKQAERGVTDLPIVDTVKMENIPDGSLGAALQERIDENKKKLEANRKAKLKLPLQSVYNDYELHNRLRFM